MDSLHSYLSLTHSLSSTLRQGWLELASAKHSMGTSRVNSSLLDLKFHSAATTLKITENHDGTQPQFMLQKWVSSEHESTQLEDKNEQAQDSDTKSSATEATLTKNLTGLADNDEVRKERDKSLSVFGVLISPKLRATQLSFEKDLKEIASLIETGSYSKEVRRNVRAVRLTIALRKKLTASVISSFIDHVFTPCVMKLIC